MELISKFNKVFWFLLYATDIHNKYEWFIHLKDKKVTIITNAFQKILDESKSEGYKPNKIWVDKDSEFSINQYKHGYKIMIWKCIQHIIKVKLSPFKKNLCSLLGWKHFKNDEKCFLFHLKRFFRSQDIYVYVGTFWSCRKNWLSRKTRLISKFITSQTC